MRAEDLFQAIGSVEESRLARTELSVPSRENQEDKTMKIRPTRIIRNFFIAAVIVSMLAVTAYAVTGYLIFDSPEEMVSAIFGDQTGFDHNPGSIQPDPNGPPTGIIVEPTFATGYLPMKPWWQKMWHPMWTLLDSPSLSTATP